MNMFCKFCGKSIDNNSTFCRFCGKPQYQNTPEKATSDTSSEKYTDTNKLATTSKSNKRKKNICYGGIILILVVCSCFFIFSDKKIADVTIDRVSQELADAVKNYDELDNFHEGLAKVYKDKKIGFIDKLGHEIIPCKYDEAEDFKLGLAIVKIGKKQGAINRQGHIVIPCKYDNINSFDKDSTASACLNGKAGKINLNGNIVIPFDYEWCDDFKEGLAAVRLNGLCGFIDKTNKLVIPCQYEDIYTWDGGFSEGLASVKKNGIFGYIDRTGKVIIPFDKKLTGAPFSSGFSTVCRGGVSMSKDKNGLLVTHEEPYEWAFIDKEGKLASKFSEFSLEGFYDEYCVVQDKNGLKGLINTRGEFVIPCKYSIIANGSSDEKYVMITSDDKFGFAKKATGQIVIPCIYEMTDAYYTFRFNEGVVPAKKDGECGFINEHNQIVIPFVYDDASEFSEGFAVVKRYGKYGYVDRYGHDTFN